MCVCCIYKYAYIYVYEQMWMLAPWKECYDKPRQCIKKLRYHFAEHGPSSQSYGFSSSHVQMWELDHKEGWTLKNWCFKTVLLEKTLESLLDFKEIKVVNPKGNQPWIFTGRTDAEAEAPILGHLMSWLFTLGGQVLELQLQHQSFQWIFRVDFL